MALGVLSQPEGTEGLDLILGGTPRGAIALSYGNSILNFFLEATIMFRHRKYLVPFLQCGHEVMVGGYNENSQILKDLGRNGQKDLVMLATKEFSKCCPVSHLWW